MTFPRTSLQLSLAALALFGAAGAAAKVNIPAVMHERHEGMESIGKAYKTLRRELDASTPNVAVVRQSATQISTLANRSSRWFPAGSGPEAGKTGAKAEIWRNWADFVRKDRAFQQSAQALRVAAARGDMTAVKTRATALGGTCKACHDLYRSEMHH